MKSSIAAFPMHGPKKFLKEGFRTRDAHLLQWITKLRPQEKLAIVARPEPIYMPTRNFLFDQKKSAFKTDNVEIVQSWSAAVPDLRNRQKWWVKSNNSYKKFHAENFDNLIVWNPMIAASNIGNEIINSKSNITFDLLDDWSIHYAFNSISEELNSSYKAMFARANTVYANSEGTLALATRFGRTDAILLTNGVDPDYFSTVSRASGNLKIGYVGKIGSRLNFELIWDMAQKFPQIDFYFAGPILEREFRGFHEKSSNIFWVGDIHYSKLPAFLETLDLAWIPHRLDKQVGGDLIKTYEFRAAGLPVLSTPVAGIEERGLSGVSALAPEAHGRFIESLTEGFTRLDRDISKTPTKHTWEFKARQILEGFELA